jgi:hypothetical protein
LIIASLLAERHTVHVQKKKVRTKLAPMHNGQVITAKRSMAKQELRAILAECPLPVLK